MDQVPVLTGQFVELRALTESDVTETYLGWLNDPETTRFLSAGSRSWDKGALLRYVQEGQTYNRVIFAIFRRDVDRHVGNVKLDCIDRDAGTAELGIMIGDEASRGRGFGTEATELTVDFALDNLNLALVYLGVHRDNAAARSSYEKVGFVEAKAPLGIPGTESSAGGCIMFITKDRRKSIRLERSEEIT